MANNHLPVVQESGAQSSVATDVRKVTTLAELGAKLPVGIAGASGLVKGFSVRPWKTKDDREIAKRKKPDMNIVQHISLIVGTMCSQLGPHPLAEMKSEERSIVMSQMYMGDVFYVYCYLRRQALGRSLGLEFTCGHCGEKIPYVANLDTLEVRTVEREEDLLWSYDLQDPIEIRSTKVKRLQMSSLRWTTLEQTAAVNQGADYVAKMAALKGSIVGINDSDKPILLAEEELDDMSKFDFEAVTEQINDHHVGPDMSVEDECKPGQCPRGGGRKFKVGINWTYDSFFAVSSR